jgi:hypothetical protein
MQLARFAPLVRSFRLITFLSSLAASAILQVACAGGGADGTNPLSPAQPQISSFAPAKSTLVLGESTSLTAIFANGAGSVAPFPGSVSVSSGIALTVAPAVTTTYTLTVSGGSGTTAATASTTITVLLPPSISSFTAAPATVSAGGSTTLNAVFTGGTGVITPGNLAISSGTGLMVGPLAATTTYTLTVTGASGTIPATRQTSVTVSGVAQPAITSFSASPTTIAAGQTSILSFTFSNGTGSINQGIGTVSSGGSKNVTPTTNTTYTLTVTGGAGTTPAVWPVTVTVSGAATRTISGLVTYDFVPAVATGAGLNFAGSVQRPVRNAILGVVNGTTALVTGTTDESGHYSLTFTPPASGTPQLVVLASASTPSIIVQDNTSGGAAYAIGTALGSSDSINLRATHGWTGSSYNSSARLAAPFAVLDSMYTAAKAFMAVRPVVFPQLKVNWSPNNVPEGGDKALGKIGTSHFDPSTNQIFILGKEGADTDEFDNHVIVHEWGHYFENNLSRSDSIGGSHGGGDVLDPRLAFGEGYGTALAAILLADPLYVDTGWNAGNPVIFNSFNAETERTPTSDDPKPGPFSEHTIIRLLYDIYDGGSNEAFDQVGVGLGTIYDVLVGPEKTTDALTTIGSFIYGLKAQPGVSVSAVNTLLAHYSIGPISSQWGDGDPNLAAMFTPVNSLPYNQTLQYDGSFGSNKWDQNQYWVVTGTGGQITVRTSCAQDVDIQVYRLGSAVARAETDSGNETASFASTAGAKYVVVVRGWGSTPGAYNVGVSITSP